MTINESYALRIRCRDGYHRSPTTGHCPSYLQANLLVLPSAYADDFQKLCARNPVPCPVLTVSKSPTELLDKHLITSPTFDLRTDLPAYNIYTSGQLLYAGAPNLKEYWPDDAEYTAFLIGCSFTFEGALVDTGLKPRHMAESANVSMYLTTRALNPAGIFTGGKYVVSMRPYKLEDVERVRDVTRPFMATHGEPIAWGWEAVEELGIRDIKNPEFGDPVEIKDGEVPVFWGCGVTPQAAVMAAGEKIKGLVMAHAPGHMLVLDVSVREYFNV